MDIKYFKNITKNEPMKNHTSFKVGGTADFFFEPSKIDELIEFLKFAKEAEIEILILGSGSNLLISDKGFRGAVISTKNLNDIEIVENKMIVGSGVTIGLAARIAQKNSLSGLEALSGIPGSIGGAMTMNAGSYGSEFKDIVKSVKVIDSDFNIKDYSNEEMKFSYRNSVVKEKNLVVLSAVLELEKGDKNEINEKMKEFSQKRTEKQPLDYPSAGSTFKRPEGNFAAKLIQDANLKGHIHKGARVSEKHSGFIINYDNATASDIYELINIVREKVYKETGILLEPEVKIIGDFR